MKNLQNFGVKELNSKEIEETQGGWIIVAAAIYLAVALYAHNTHH